MMTFYLGQFIPERRLEGVKMARLNGRVATVAALAAFGMIVGVGGVAKGELSALALSKGGIVQVGGGGNGTDPPYTYQFEADLTGTLTSWPTTSFTVKDLVGVYLFDPSGTGPSGWSYSITPEGILDYKYAVSDVTWTYLGPTITSPNNGSGTLDLGVFQITTQPNLPGGYPSILPTTINYNYSLDGGSSSGGSSGQSTVSLTPGGIQAVPEPSTLIAPLVVLLGLPVVRFLKRRRAPRAILPV